MRQPPAKYWETGTGMCPEASKLTMSLSEEHMGNCRGTSAVSKRVEYQISIDVEFSSVRHRTRDFRQSN